VQYSQRVVDAEDEVIVVVEAVEVAVVKATVIPAKKK
jgi:hypothetical protein